MIWLTHIYAPFAQSSRALIRLALCAGSSLALTACATLDPFGGMNEPSATSLAVVPMTSAFDNPSSAEHKRLIAQFGGEYKSAALEDFLNSILTRLSAAETQPGQKYQVTILNTPAVNAFALPSGYLYLTRGLLALANDSAEVAAVMAHEIAHVTARHALARAELEKTEALKSKVASAIQSRARSQELQANGRLTLSGFSREQEIEADRMGVRMIAQAGFDPFAAARFLTSLERSSAMRARLMGGKTQASVADLSASHPSTPERIAKANDVARQITAPGFGESNREAYLALLNGLDFGDNPAEGLVRGRLFQHPKLGFEFTAPERFVLENSAKALLGLVDGGEQALRLDSVALPADSALESYLTTGWIEGLQKDSIQKRFVNGLDGAIAKARNGNWDFRIGVIRLDSSVYRLIFAAHSPALSADQRFIAAIDSFRRLSVEERVRLHPSQIAILTAAEGDTLASLSARMSGGDRSLENFMILNGLDKSLEIRTGQNYKIIID